MTIKPGGLPYPSNFLPKMPKITSEPLAVPKIKPMDIPPSSLTASVNSNHASEFHKRLTKWINEFDSSLDQEHEVGVRLVSFGQAVTFHLESLSYWNPSLIFFRGTLEAGEPVELIQHVSQISVLLMKVRRRDPGQPKRTIGFNLASDHEGSATEDAQVDS
jgi:hypothetical protein